MKDKSSVFIDEIWFIKDETKDLNCHFELKERINLRFLVPRNDIHYLRINSIFGCSVKISTKISNSVCPFPTSNSSNFSCAHSTLKG